MRLRRSDRASLSGQFFDVAVIGGGVNGVAIARECARAGRSTLLVEQNDFASGTTSRSTRIIHGGLRYLEHGEIGLVRESLRERERLLRERPHLVRPLQFVLALKPGATRSALLVRSGLWLYARLAHEHGMRPSSDLARDMAAARKLETLLDAGRRWSLFSYEDAQCEFPERLVAEWLRDAVDAGAVARNHTAVLRVICSAGRVRGLLVRDALTGDEARVECETVVNAAGPWVDRVIARAGVSTAEPLVGGVRGSHIVVSPFAGAPQAAVYAEASDGRPFFFVPWNRQLLVGTTEVADRGDPGATQPSNDEIAYLLRSANRTFPAARLDAEDIHYAFAGVRPLPYSPKAASGAVTRRHRLVDHGTDGAMGMLSVVGGKLTTAAAVARDVARRLGIAVIEPAVALAPTPADFDNLVLELARETSQAGGLTKAAGREIAEWYGSAAPDIADLAHTDAVLRQPLCAHTQHVVAEAVFAAQHECAHTLADMVLRRVPVALGKCWSRECTRLAAQRVGKALRWSSERIMFEQEECEAERTQFMVQPTSDALRSMDRSAREAETAADRTPPGRGAAATQKPQSATRVA